MKRIGIIANMQKTGAKQYAHIVVQSLKGRAGIYTNEEYSGDDFDITRLTYEDLAKQVDCMIVMGGDGTIIRAAGNCARYGVPILGVNLGRIGFMTEIEPDMIDDALTALLEGKYKTEKRMMMKMQIKRNGEIFSTCHALNDIVVSKSAGVKLIGIDLYTDNELVNSYISDGIIIATPTGSTGYSISAGGPVVDPRMDLYVATPICAHMLSVRSAILSSDRQIKIRLSRDYNSGRAIVSADGEVQSEIRDNDEVIITRSQYQLELIKIGDKSFYDTLMKKL